MAGLATSRASSLARLPVPNEEQIRRAEHEYHECVRRFGHLSAEAHAARYVWRRLRRSRA